MLSKRDQINEVLRTKLDEITENWGGKVTRVEIREITPPRDILDSMNRMLSAERTRRAVITESEGARQSAINVAEGQKQSEILKAEGERQAAILRAEGFSEALTRIFQAATGVDQKTMSLQYLEALKALGAGPSTKFVIPFEFTRLLEPFLDYLEPPGIAAASPVAGASAGRPGATVSPADEAGRRPATGRTRATRRRRRDPSMAAGRRHGRAVGGDPAGRLATRVGAVARRAAGGPRRGGPRPGARRARRRGRPAAVARRPAPRRRAGCRPRPRRTTGVDRPTRHEAILLLHGYPGSIAPDLVEYGPFLRRTAGVLGLDFRGHGESDDGPTTFGLLEVEDVAGALAWLGERGITRVALVGTSMGGITAIAAVAVLGDGSLRGGRRGSRRAARPSTGAPAARSSRSSPIRSRRSSRSRSANAAAAARADGSWPPAVRRRRADPRRRSAGDRAGSGDRPASSRSRCCSSTARPTRPCRIADGRRLAALGRPGRRALGRPGRRHSAGHAAAPAGL